MKKRIITVTILALILAACGGGGGESTPEITTPTPTSKTMAGKIIDGYVTGATVFLDINNDGIQDPDEPFTISAENGDYSMEVPLEQAECGNIVPVIVDVPVGAIDADLGEVLEAYRLVLPPSFDPLAEFTNRHVTPLTTTVWYTINQVQTQSAIGMTCAEIVRDTDAQIKAQQLLSDTLKMTSMTYNLSESDIYSDYIAEQNQELQSVAENIVRGLQKSYADTVILNQNHPDADWVQVIYRIQDLQRFDESGTLRTDPIQAWYRDTYIRENSVYTVATEHMEDDLSTATVLVKYDRTNTTVVNVNVELNERYVITTSWDSQIADYGSSQCSAFESLEVANDGVVYGLTNAIELASIEDYVVCIEADFSEMTTRTKFIDTQVLDSVSGGSTGQYFTNSYGNDNINDLPDLFNMQENIGLLNTSRFIDNITSVVNTDYDNDELGDADAVRKTNSYVTSSLNSVRLTKYISDGFIELSRFVMYADNTRSLETSRDGITWDSVYGAPIQSEDLE